MRVTLDWDSPELRDMHRDDAIERTRQGLPTGPNFDPPRPWEEWQSSGGQGYHMIDYGGSGPDIDMNLGIRESLGDDKLRLSLDSDRVNEGSPYYQVLYHMKEVRRRDSPPFSTDKRASLIERRNAAEGPLEFIDADGTLDYPAAFRALKDAAGHDSRAETMRVIRERFDTYRQGSRRLYAPADTRADARAYDLVNGRRTPYPAERAALVSLLYDVVLRVDQPAHTDLLARLADTSAYGGETAVQRAIQDRISDQFRQRRADSPISTDPVQRRYDIMTGRRSPHPAERAALFEIAVEAGIIGNDRLADLPTRTTMHEYLSVPDLGGYDPVDETFDRDKGESDTYRCNIRTGWFGDRGTTLADLGERTPDRPDMAAIKAVHDAFVDKVVDLLSPGPLNVNRLMDGIAVEDRRRLDRDEMARNRKTINGHPNDVPEEVRDPFGYVVVEMMLWDDDYSNLDWCLRGLVRTDVAYRMAETGESQTLDVAHILRDTRGWW